MLVRDPDGRVLLCQLTYKRDWDLPGGVVEVGESPRLAVRREVEEELGLDVDARRAAAHRLAPAVGRLGRRRVPRLRRRRPRRRPSSTGWSSRSARSATCAFCTLEEVDELRRRLHGATRAGGGRRNAAVYGVRPLRQDAFMTWVYDFAEGNKDQKDLLGGKGANLAEMTNLGLPVPPGFTISTEACRAYLASRSRASGEPEGLAEEVTEHLASLEEAMGTQLGDADDPLLVSVRSGAKFSMPGMMETVLNVGLNDASVDGLARQSEDDRFAQDSYRRLLQMFGATVLARRLRALLRGARRGEEGQGHRQRPRPRRRRPARAGRDVQVDHQGADRPRLPAGPARADRPRRSAPSSTPGTPTGPGSTAARSASPRTSAPRSTSRRWSSATSAWTPARASRSPATRPAAPRASTATTSRTPRARTSSPASATPSPSPTWPRSTARRTTT